MEMKVLRRKGRQEYDDEEAQRWFVQVNLLRKAARAYEGADVPETFDTIYFDGNEAAMRNMSTAGTPLEPLPRMLSLMNHPTGNTVGAVMETLGLTMDDVEFLMAMRSQGARVKREDMAGHLRHLAQPCNRKQRRWLRTRLKSASLAKPTKIGFVSRTLYFVIGIWAAN